MQKKTNPSRFELRPNISVGALEFGQEIEPLVKEGTLVEVVDSEDQDDRFIRYSSRVFAYPDDPEGDELLVFADETGTTIEDIHCHRSLKLGEAELIGATLPDVVKLVGSEPDEIEQGFELGEGNFQDIAEFERLGLQVWTKDGAVVSIFASNEIE